MSDHLGDIFTFYPGDLSKGRSAQMRLLPGLPLAAVPPQGRTPHLHPCHTLGAVPLSPRSSRPVRAIPAGVTPWKGPPSLRIKEVQCSEPVLIWGPWEALSLLEGAPGSWQVSTLAGGSREELRFCPQTLGEQGTDLGRRGTCVLERSSDHLGLKQWGDTGVLSRGVGGRHGQRRGLGRGSLNVYSGWKVSLARRLSAECRDCQGGREERGSLHPQPPSLILDPRVAVTWQPLAEG